MRQRTSNEAKTRHFWVYQTITLGEVPFVQTLVPSLSHGFSRVVCASSLFFNPFLPLRSHDSPTMLRFLYSRTSTHSHSHFETFVPFSYHSIVMNLFPHDFYSISAERFSKMKLHLLNHREQSYLEVPIKEINCEGTATIFIAEKREWKVYWSDNMTVY